MQYYSLDIEQVGQTKQIYSDCNSISFYNQGTNDVSIEQMIVLSPGQSFVIEGNEDEICSHRFLITFSGAGVNNCIVIKKIYVNR